MSMTDVKRFSFDPDSPSQRRADALAFADEKLHSDLVAARIRAGLTQQTVAERLGVSQPTIAAFERYDNDPHLSTVRRYAHAVGVVISHSVREDDGHASCSWEALPTRSRLKVQRQPEAGTSWAAEPLTLFVGRKSAHDAA